MRHRSLGGSPSQKGKSGHADTTPKVIRDHIHVFGFVKLEARVSDPERQLRIGHGLHEWVELL